MNINEIMSKYFSDLSNPIDIDKYGNDILKIFNNSSNQCEKDEILNLILGLYDRHKTPLRHSNHRNEKYYLMAIEQDHSKAMDNLGFYYHHVEKNYDLMKKYYQCYLLL